jgi:putative sterol carrier protein
MPEFLSPEWIAALDASARSSDALAEAGDFAVQMVIRDTPSGEMTYHVVVADESARVGAGPTESPDLTLTADYDVACAISRGTANAQAALASGRFKITGRLELLRGRESVFATIEDLFAGVRASTTYPERTMPP